jgi:hypothetical protein
MRTEGRNHESKNQDEQSRNEDKKSTNQDSYNKDITSSYIQHSSPAIENTLAAAIAAPSVVGQQNKVVQVSQGKPESDHQLGMSELARLIGAIPDGKAQGAALKWLLGNNHTIDECIECLRELTAELRDPGHWREARVSWMTVKKEIGGWKIKLAGRAEATQCGGQINGSNGQRTEGRSRFNSGQTGERKPTRDERILEQLSRQDPNELFPATEVRAGLPIS